MPSRRGYSVLAIIASIFALAAERAYPQARVNGRDTNALVFGAKGEQPVAQDSACCNGGSWPARISRSTSLDLPMMQ